MSLKTEPELAAPEREGARPPAGSVGASTRAPGRWGLPAAGSPRAAWIEPIAIGLLVAVGLYMRVAGVAFGRSIGFWNDEANWAIRVVNQPLEDLLIRPIGFMLLTRWSVALLGKWEFAFRLLPWLAGLATPFIAVFLARRFLTRPAARLLLIGILCLSPVAVDYSKEFKPYGVSLMLHLLLPLLVLRWHQTRRTRDLVLAGIAAPLALFFTQDIIFLYPGLFLVLGIESWRARSWRQLGATAGFAVLSAGVVLGMYTLIWSRMPDGQSEYWGRKYGVFYRPTDPSDTALGWYATKYAEITELPGARRRLFDPQLVPSPLRERLQSVDERVWLAMHLLGLAVIALQRRYREALLFLSPVLVCTVFNLLGLWPYGAFRTNVFFLAGMSAIAALGMDWRGLPKRAWTALVPLSLLVLAPLALSRNEWGATKQVVSSSRMPEVLDHLLALPETQNIRREPFILDHHSFNVVRYYVRHHARAAEWSKPVKRKFKLHYQKLPKGVFKAARRLPPGRRGWIMVRGRAQPPPSLQPRLVIALAGFSLFTVQGPKRR